MPKKNWTEVELVDMFPRSKKRFKLKVKLELRNGALMITPKGYGDCTSQDGQGIPIMLSLDDDQLKLQVWADINAEDMTHNINLSGAKESSRIKP